MKKFILQKDYPELDISKMHIYLLEGSPNVLNSMSPAAKAKARQYLTKMGVDIHTQTVVQDYDGKNAILKDGTTIPAALMIWAAGIRGNLPQGIDPSLVSPGNRVKVGPDFKVQGSDNVFAIGDISYMEHPDFPKGIPQLANVAIEEAEYLSGNFKRMAAGKSLSPFHFKFQGSMATVGRNKAVVDLNKPRISFQGLFAWFVWMSVHLFLLMGFKNRLLVFINWGYKYITFDNSLRLIYTRPPYPVHQEEVEAMTPSSANI